METQAGAELSTKTAMLVYRLVCQPVTLESWVRFPDVALQHLQSDVIFTNHTSNPQTILLFWRDQSNKAKSRTSFIKNKRWRVGLLISLS